MKLFISSFFLAGASNVDEHRSVLVQSATESPTTSFEPTREGSHTGLPRLRGRPWAIALSNLRPWAPDDLEQIEPEFTELVDLIMGLWWEGGRRDFPDSTRIFAKAYRDLQKTDEDPAKLFRRIRGTWLFSYASRSSQYRFVRSALNLAASIPMKDADVETFRKETGITGFCVEHGSSIYEMAMAFVNSEHSRVSVPSEDNANELALGYSFLWRYCPELIERYPELRASVIAARAYISVSRETGVPDMDIPMVSQTRPFTDAAGSIMGNDPRSLRLRMRTVGYAEDFHSPTAVHDFLYLSGREIFSNPEFGLFGENGLINGAGSLELYEPAGRLVAMALLNYVYLGISLPEVYLSALIGQQWDHSEMDSGNAQRLALFVRGFQSVIPPWMLNGVVNAEQLGELFVGCSEVSLDDLMERSSFAVSPLREGSPHYEWFDSYLKSLSKADLFKLVTKITGSAVLPFRGLKGEHRTIYFLLFDGRDDYFQGPIQSRQEENLSLRVPFFNSEQEMIEALVKFLHES